jgi:hypothetical protein
MGKSTTNGNFHSYVKLPEGIPCLRFPSLSHDRRLGFAVAHHDIPHVFVLVVTRRPRSAVSSRVESLGFSRLNKKKKLGLMDVHTPKIWYFNIYLKKIYIYFNVFHRCPSSLDDGSHLGLSSNL